MLRRQCAVEPTGATAATGLQRLGTAAGYRPRANGLDQDQQAVHDRAGRGVRAERPRLGCQAQQEQQQRLPKQRRPRAVTDIIGQDGPRRVPRQPGQFWLVRVPFPPAAWAPGARAPMRRVPAWHACRCRLGRRQDRAWPAGSLGQAQQRYGPRLGHVHVATPGRRPLWRGRWAALARRWPGQLAKGRMLGQSGLAWALQVGGDAGAVPNIVGPALQARRRRLCRCRVGRCCFRSDGAVAALCTAQWVTWQPR